MNYKIKKNKKQRKKIIIILLLIIAIISFSASFGRYAINAITDFYLRSKEFYFYSDKLSLNTPVFRVDNWSGVDDYNVTINMNSRANNILAATYNIDYSISYTCSTNAVCTLSKTTGTILSTTNTDFFNLTITPNQQLVEGDTVFVEITAQTTTPYAKIIKGQFVLKVGKEALTYKIVDSTDSPYLELDITNTLSYYTVSEAFGTYSVGDKITSDVYLGLTTENKAKCYSAEITLSFNPSTVVLDMNNTNYLNASNVTTTTVNYFNYINGLTFKIDAVSSTKVRFFKNDITQDYTYPNTGGTSPIITLTSR